MINLVESYKHEISISRAKMMRAKTVKLMSFIDYLNKKLVSTYLV